MESEQMLQFKHFGSKGSKLPPSSFKSTPAILGVCIIKKRAELYRMGVDECFRFQCFPIWKCLKLNLFKKLFNRKKKH